MTDVNKLLQTGVALHRSGQIDDAEHAYQLILQSNPSHFEALHLSGVIQFQRGNITKAVPLIQAALQINPKSVAANYNLGIALARISRFADAIASFDRAIALDPQHVEARKKRLSTLRDWEVHSNPWTPADYDPCNSLVFVDADDLIAEGNSLFREGRFDEAVACYDHAIAQDAINSDAHLNRGAALRKLQRFAEAIKSLDRALVLNPRDADAYINRGNVLQDSGRLEEAIASHNQALALNPFLDVAYCNRGSVFRQLGRLVEALSDCDQAIALNPCAAKGYATRANVLHDLDRPKEALASSDQAIAIAPDDADIWLGRALIWERLQKPNEALVCYDRAIAIKPDFAEAYLYRGVVLGMAGQFEEEMASYDLAIAQKPDLAAAHFQRGLATLLRGNYSHGWQGYDCRAEESEAKLQLPQQKWKGEDLHGKSLLVYREQGVGDEIMFASCIPEILNSVKRLLIISDERLVPLLARSFPTSQCVGWKSMTAQLLQRFGSIDFQVGAGSLPRYLRQSLEQFPQRRRYLQPDAAAHAAWKERLANLGGKLNVGVSWRGGASPLTIHRRSTSLDQWAAVFSVSKVNFVNLQYGDVSAQMENAHQQLGVYIHHFAEIDPLKNMDDFAALISALDLVISIDNSTVHLAGALGVPTWVALPFVPDWRWLLEREDSPWYPSLRLFRQKTIGNWEDVFASIAAELYTLTNLTTKLL